MSSLRLHEYFLFQELWPRSLELRPDKCESKVRELLISSDKTSAFLLFAENEKRFSCLWFSITHPHYLKLDDTQFL